MKEKHKNGCNSLITTFTNLESYLYSKKCLKQWRQPPPPPRSLQQSRLLFAVEYVYPADRVTQCSVYRSP